MYYWDASALVKLYVSEPDSESLDDLLVSCRGFISTSALAGPELLCAFYRKQKEGGLRAEGAAELYRRFGASCEAGRISIVPYTQDVIDEAARLIRLSFGQPQPVMIRALDLIHLASAIVSKADVLVTTDDRLRHLAAMAGVPVLPRR